MDFNAGIERARDEDLAGSEAFESYENGYQFEEIDHRVVKQFDWSLKRGAVLRLRFHAL